MKKEIEVAIPSYSEVLFLPENWSDDIRDGGGSRNPFLFRGPIPTQNVLIVVAGALPSQSLLIQRSYSYCRSCRNLRFLPVAIPSYSEVLFLLVAIWKNWSDKLVAIPSYSEVLFLLTEKLCAFKSACRNPFLFRGPIPTF
jgi:hypothetical protein